MEPDSIRLICTLVTLEAAFTCFIDGAIQDSPGTIVFFTFVPVLSNAF